MSCALSSDHGHLNETRQLDISIYFWFVSELWRGPVLQITSISLLNEVFSFCFCGYLVQKLARCGQRMPYETLHEASVQSSRSRFEQMAKANLEQRSIITPESAQDPLESAWVRALTIPRGPLATPAHWIPDTSVQGCMLCGSRFTLLKRRHHCRRCGACVCDKCSNARLPLNLLPDGRARKPPSGEIKRVVEKQIEKIAHDTNLEYVRCCKKCAEIVDGRLKSALHVKFNDGSEDAEETKDFDAISV